MRRITTVFAKFGISPTDAFRSILSGGHKESFGDISLSSSLAALFPFAVECKWYKKLDLYKLLLPWDKMGKSNLFRQWWIQTLEGAEKSKTLYPLLVFKANNKETFCMLYYGDFWRVLRVPIEEIDIPFIKQICNGRVLLCFRFGHLLKLLAHKAKKGNNNGKISSDKRSRV